jgi:hemerythrin-like domain-containing protein
MNTATKNLEDDHVHILRLIEVMEHITGSDDPDIADMEMIVDTIRNFADGLHHAKEENIFFPFLVGKGFSNSSGPVAVMLHEHVLGRNFVKGMADNIALYKSGNKEALAGIFTNMSEYDSLLKNHISKENNILFQMANRVLSESDHRDLLISFEEAQKSHNSTKGAEKYIEQINNLASFYKL